MDKLFYIIRGIGALYELCAPSSTSHFSLLTKVQKLTNRYTSDWGLGIRD